MEVDDDEVLGVEQKRLRDIGDGGGREKSRPTVEVQIPKRILARAKLMNIDDDSRKHIEATPKAPERVKEKTRHLLNRKHQ